MSALWPKTSTQYRSDSFIQITAILCKHFVFFIWVWDVTIPNKIYFSPQSVDCSRWTDITILLHDISLLYTSRNNIFNSENIFLKYLYFSNGLSIYVLYVPCYGRDVLWTEKFSGNLRWSQSYEIINLLPFLVNNWIEWKYFENIFIYIIVYYIVYLKVSKHQRCVRFDYLARSLHMKFTSTV